MIISGFSYASSTLVGNSLGASRPADAKVYVNISVFIALFLFVVLGILLYAFRVQVAYFFTEDDELAHMIIITIPIMILMNLGDFMQGKYSNVIFIYYFERS